MLIALLLVALGGAAAGASGSVSGRLTADGLPLKEANVRLVRLAGTNAGELGDGAVTARSDAEGRFAFEGLAAGVYVVEYESRRALAGEAAFIRVPAFVGAERMNVDLGAIETAPGLAMTVHLGGDVSVAGGEVRVSLSDWEEGRPLAFIASVGGDLGRSAFSTLLFHPRSGEEPAAGPLAEAERVVRIPSLGDGAYFPDDHVRTRLVEGVYEMRIAFTTTNGRYFEVTAGDVRFERGRPDSRVRPCHGRC